MKIIFVLCLLVSFSFGINAQTQNSQSALSNKESNLVKQEALRLWEKRDVKESLEESLSKFEMALEKDADIEIPTYLARGYFLLAEFHNTDDEVKKRFYEKAKDYAGIALATNQDFLKLMKDDMEKAIDKLTIKEIEPLFWRAASLGKWARLNGIFSSLSYKSEILAMIKKVENLKPDFFHSSVPRYWGGFYAVAPSIAGGDMKKSKKKFHEAMEKSPEYLGTKVLYAELYLVKDGDRKEFKKQLEQVIASPNGPKELEPENRMEKKKAEYLLERMSSLF